MLFLALQKQGESSQAVQEAACLRVFARAAEASMYSLYSRCIETGILHRAHTSALVRRSILQFRVAQSPLPIRWGMGGLLEQEARKTFHAKLCKLLNEP